jgi:hypothetical protein
MLQVVTSSTSKGTFFIINKYQKLKANRGTWETHWEELTRYFIPGKDNIYGGETKGEKKGNTLFDAIGIRCTEQLASALHGMLTNPATQWFSFSSGESAIDNIPAVAAWLQTAAKKELFVLNNSNFQSEIHEVYIDLSGFGTSHLRTEEDEIETVRFTSRPIYEVVVSENFKGIIDTVYYRYQVTLEQLVEQFPNLPQPLKDLRHQEPLKEYYVIHAIEPSSRLPPELSHATLPFTSLYVLEDGAVELSRGGFEENPCIISRFSKLSGEMFGRSPAMKAMPDVKTANQMMKTWLEGAQLAVQPPMQAPDEGVLMPIRLVPGGVNYYRADSKDRIEPILTGANPNIGNQIIELLHNNIKSSFYIDQLHLVESDRMTATEVMQRRDEQLRAMSPILGRLQYELLAPIVMRVFGIMMRKGMMGEIPKELKGKSLEVKFVSQIARAQESIEGENFMRAFQSVGGLAQLDPSVIDILDMDKTARFLFKTYGAPLENLRKDAELVKIRKARAEQQQAQSQAELANVNSESAKNISQAQGKQIQ